MTTPHVGCPDCDSEVELRELAEGMYMLIVRHDTTCPNENNPKARWKGSRA